MDPQEQPTVEWSGSAGTGGSSEQSESLGPYRLLSLLGEGGFGEVWMAEQLEPVRRRVAIKMLKPGMDSRQVIARFEAERQALAMMDHPGVAKVFDAGLSPHGRPYFVMELVQGAPITLFCEQERLDIEARVRLMIQVGDSVHHAHMRGVIHRDLKPGNILVELIDGKPHVKVIDFGVAKALTQPLGGATLFTEQGQLIGTPEYMSPEQARGSATGVDTRSDVYSLGAVLYELLTGHPPFESGVLRGKSYADLQQYLERTEPVRPSTRITTSDGEAPAHIKEGTVAVTRRIKGDLDWIVMRCLEKERDRRYDTASNLVADLERFLRDEPVEAGPPGARYRLRKFVRRHRGLVVGGLTVLMVLILGVIGTSSGLIWALSERERVSAEAARANTVERVLTRMLTSADPNETSRPGYTVLDMLEDFDRREEFVVPDQPLVEASVRQTMARSYRGLGRLDDALRHAEVAARLFESELGRTHPETLSALGTLAFAYSDLGRSHEAAKLDEEVLAERRRTLGDTHSDTIWAMNNLAADYRDLGRGEEALALSREAYETRRRTLGKDHEDTLWSLNTLANGLRDDGLYEDALERHTRVANGWSDIFGEDDPQTLWAVHARAMDLRDLGRVEEARDLDVRILQSRRATLGDDHPDTLWSMEYLALDLTLLGRDEEALQMLNEALAGRTRALGPHHADTNEIRFQIVDLLHALNRQDETAPLVRATIESSRIVAERPEATAEDLNNCAWDLLTTELEELRDPDTALRMAERACAFEELEGSVRADYLDTLAMAQHAVGQVTKAVETQRDAVDLATDPDVIAEFRERLAKYQQDAATPESTAP